MGGGSSRLVLDVYVYLAFLFLNLHSFERSSQPPNLVDTEYRMCIAFVKTQDVLMCFVCTFNADHPFQACISKHVHSLYHWTVMDRFITLLVFLDS